MASLIVEAEEEEVGEWAVQIFVGSSGLGPGTLRATTRKVVWQPEQMGTQGFSLSYPAIIMHAVSRDTTSFHSPCIYLQLDGSQQLGGNAHPNAANGDAAPMDVSASTAMATKGPEGDAAAGNDGDDSDDEESGGDDSDDEEAQEVRIVPSCAPGGDFDSLLDAIFSALSRGAALNPDDDCDDDDSDEDGLVEEGEYDDDDVIGIQDAFSSGQTMLDESAMTPAQLQMLARYDAMLSDSAAEPEGVPIVHNTDGRFDDPDDEPPASDLPPA